jgi:hypothetical protein
MRVCVENIGFPVRQACFAFLQLPERCKSVAPINILATTQLCISIPDVLMLQYQKACIENSALEYGK